VTGPRLNVAWNDKSVVVSRSPFSSSGSAPGPARFLVPPLAVGVLTAVFTSVELGVLAASIVFFGVAYATPGFRRRRNSPVVAAPRLTLAGPEREVFEGATRTVDRIRETWPRLGGLIAVPDAERSLADALWEIAAVLSRRQELSGVLAQLSRPDFAVRAPGDETAQELQTHRRAAEEALAVVDADLARRLASLHRADQAGREFIREEEMRAAIRAARESLGDAGDLPVLPVADPAAELADHTRSVLEAYRELTSDLRLEPPG
jgi:hypothetical protein